MNTTLANREVIIREKLNNSTKARFLLVGATMTALDFALLILLDNLTPLTAVQANIVSTFTAFCVSFVANKRYTFKTSGTNIVREMVLFTIVTLFGLWVLQSIVIHWLLPHVESIIPWREVALIATKVVATFTSMIWNYLTYSRIVFVHKNKPEKDA